MQKTLSLFLLLFTSLTALAQSHTISGTITDHATGETLIGTTILDSRSGKGTITNSYGRFSLTLPDGQVTLVIRFVGYKPYLDTFLLTGNRVLNVALDPSIELEEVVVVGEKIDDVRSSQVSVIDIPVEHIKAVPVLFGETDILKVVQLLPGVQSGTEGMSGIYVRGGGSDENLFLLDGVSLYNVNHLGGFFSAFNSDAVKNVTLYKGSFPARFGGRLSSVLDVTTNNGNDKQLHGNVSIGLISSKLNLEGPIRKERTTFSVSMRRTYLDLFTIPIIYFTTRRQDQGSQSSGGYHFYDLNGKMTHKFSDKSRLYASYYMGDDRAFINTKGTTKAKIAYNWGNIVGSVRWNYELTPKLFMNVTGAYTRYRNQMDISNQVQMGNAGWDKQSMTYHSGIHDFTARADFDYAHNPNHAVKFGADYIHHIFTPEITGMRSTLAGGGSTIDTNYGDPRVHANELNAYIEDDWALCDFIKLNAGLRLSGFAVQDTFYPSLQPRLSASIMLRDNLSLKVGYAYMQQYMHLLSNSKISLPTDLWVPVTQRIIPMHAHQVSAGFFYKWHDLMDFSMEGYYKKMDNLLEYRDGTSFWGSRQGWENKVATGEGWSYGIEFMAQKSVGKWTGWLAYTWSKTMHLFNREGMMINNGKAFPSKYDRRHDVSIVVMYKKNDRFDISGTWVFGTGNAVTLCRQTYSDGYYYNIPYIEHRNDYRMPNYHRMDIGMNFHKQKVHGTRTWNVSIYNVYNHLNPFMIHASNDDTNNKNGTSKGNNKLMQTSLFPIIPSVTYSFIF